MKMQEMYVIEATLMSAILCMKCQSSSGAWCFEMLDSDVNFERYLGDLSWVLNARLINANKMKSGGDLYGMQACSQYGCGCWVLGVWFWCAAQGTCEICDAFDFAGRR
jgi:hypothetical protein